MSQVDELAVTAAYPLVDGSCASEARNVYQVVKQAQKLSEPVLVRDKPWEGNGPYLYGTVLRDRSGTFKMWYQTWTVFDDDTIRLHYATSSDGIRWEKPALGAAAFEGAAHTNIVGNHHNPSIIFDEQDQDQNRRFKLWCYMYGSGYEVWYSADGLRWQRGTHNPVGNHGDVGYASSGLPRCRFVATMRMLPSVRGRIRRAVGISLTDNFDRWPQQSLVLVPDEHDDMVARQRGFLHTEVYGMPVFWMEGLWYGLPMMFYVSNPVADRPKGYDDGDIDIGLAYSHDLLVWHRPVDRRPVVPLGEAHEFDSHMITVPNGPVFVGDELWLYYGGWNASHGGSADRLAAVGLARWRVGRLIGLANFGHEDGYIVTHPVLRGGESAWVNATVYSGGYVKAEILNEGGDVVPGYGVDQFEPVRGDSLRHRLRWRTAHGLPNLHRLRFRFWVRNAEVFGFGFAPTREECVEGDPGR